MTQAEFLTYNQALLQNIAITLGVSISDLANLTYDQLLLIAINEGIEDIIGGGGGVTSINGTTGAIDIKTLNGTSLLGTGNIAITKTDVGLSNVDNTSDINKPISNVTQTALNNKQDVLVSGTNIKSINGTSLLGSGNVVIGGSGEQVNVVNSIISIPVIDENTEKPFLIKNRDFATMGRRTTERFKIYEPFLDLTNNIFNIIPFNGGELRRYNSIKVSPEYSGEVNAFLPNINSSLVLKMKGHVNTMADSFRNVMTRMIIKLVSISSNADSFYGWVSGNTSTGRRVGIRSVYNTITERMEFTFETSTGTTSTIITLPFFSYSLTNTLELVIDVLLFTPRIRFTLYNGNNIILDNVVSTNINLSECFPTFVFSRGESLSSTQYSNIVASFRLIEI